MRGAGCRIFPPPEFSHGRSTRHVFAAPVHIRLLGSSLLKYVQVAPKMVHDTLCSRLEHVGGCLHIDKLFAA